MHADCNDNKGIGKLCTPNAKTGELDGMQKYLILGIHRQYTITISAVPLKNLQGGDSGCLDIVSSLQDQNTWQFAPAEYA
jgi:hypothetical protein